MTLTRPPEFRWKFAAPRKNHVNTTPLHDATISGGLTASRPPPTPRPVCVCVRAFITSPDSFRTLKLSKSLPPPPPQRPTLNRLLDLTARVVRFLQVNYLAKVRKPALHSKRKHVPPSAKIRIVYNDTFGFH